jgi:hypothetical protein
MVRALQQRDNEGRTGTVQHRLLDTRTVNKQARIDRDLTLSQT